MRQVLHVKEVKSVLQTLIIFYCCHLIFFLVIKYINLWEIIGLTVTYKMAAFINSIGTEEIPLELMKFNCHEY